MFLYVLLILGQVFANQELADRIYYCVSKSASYYKNTSDKFTVREATEACRDEIGARHIQVVEAKITEGTTHYIKLLWKNNGRDEFRHFAFNIRNTKLCNEDEKRGAAKSLVLSLRDIIDNDQNSLGMNYCKDINDKLGTSEKYGFGFKRKKQNGPCIRTCDDGQVLRGTSANLLYNTNVGSSNVTVVETAAVSPKFLGMVFLDVQCTKCPQEGPNKDMSYTETHSENNLCYNADGCEQGYELTRSSDLSEGKPSIKNPKKWCVPKCSSDETRRSDGGCKMDKTKQCEAAKITLKNPPNWLNRFLSASQTQTIGSCDMELIRDTAKEFTAKKLISLKADLEYVCNDKTTEDTSGVYQNQFADYLIHRIPEMSDCIHHARKNPRFDLGFYNLLSEDIVSKNPHQLFY